MNTALRASAYEVTAAILICVGSSGIIVVLWRIRSMICDCTVRGSAEQAGDCRGRGSNLDSPGYRDPLPKLFRKDCLKERPAQADPEYLSGCPEKIRDPGGDGDILSPHVCNDGLMNGWSEKRAAPMSTHAYDQRCGDHTRYSEAMRDQIQP